VHEDAWQDLGTISDEPATPKRKPARYHGYETVVDLYGLWFRALVILSDALDERRVKRLNRLLDQDWSDMERFVREAESIEYARLADAQAALSRLERGRFHEAEGEVTQEPIYPRGRPKADGRKKVMRMRYRLKLTIKPKEQAIERA